MDQGLDRSWIPETRPEFCPAAMRGTARDKTMTSAARAGADSFMRFTVNSCAVTFRHVASNARNVQTRLLDANPGVPALHRFVIQMKARQQADTLIGETPINRMLVRRQYEGSAQSTPGTRLTDRYWFKKSVEKRNV